MKPKREAAALSAASAPVAAPLSSAFADGPDGWAESTTADDTAGQWDIPHKHTKLSNHQANSSPAAANGIKAMRDAEGLKGSMGSDIAEGSRQRRGPRSRGRGHNRGRGRGRSYSNNHRTTQDQPQQVRGNDGWSHDPSATAQHNSAGEDEGVSSSWGADTVFPLSPLNPSLLTNAEGARSSAPRVLTIPRPPQTRSMTTADGGAQQQQPKQQQSRGRRDNRARGSSSNGRGGRGRQSAQAGRVQSCPVYDISDQPACQQFSFGSFGAEFGSTLQGSTTNPATDDGNGSSSSHVYQQQQHEHVPRQQSHNGIYRGRGRGRGQFSGRGRFASERNNRQNGTQDNAVTVA